MKKNTLREFFGPTKLRVMLTIVATLIATFFIGPFETIASGFPNSTYSPIGITNTYLSLLVSFIFFYLIFSLIVLSIKRMRND